MKTTFSVFFFFLSILGSSLFAQSSIVVGGGESKNSNVNMSYTIGQDIFSLLSTVVEPQNTGGSTGGTGGGTGGGGETPVGVIDTPYGATVSVLAYPNPTNGVFYLEFKNLENFEKWSYQVVDLIGVPLLKHQILDQKTTIDVTDLLPGTYLLIVLHNNSYRKTIKFIVNNK